MRISASLTAIAGVPRPRKGDLTRAAIVAAASEIASREGLEGLTIGSLAERMQMSKSGLFAHFGSREELQLAVLKAYERRFVDEVLRPAVREPRGLPRLTAILQRWVSFLAGELAHGCILVAGAFEYDDRQGPMRDAMVAIIAGWKSELQKAIRQAAAEGHLKRGIDAPQMVFEIYGLMLAMHQDARLLRSADSARRARAGLQRLIDSASSADAPKGTKALSSQAARHSAAGRSQRTARKPATSSKPRRAQPKRASH